MNNRRYHFKRDLPLVHTEKTRIRRLLFSFFSLALIYLSGLFFQRKKKRKKNQISECKNTSWLYWARVAWENRHWRFNLCRIFSSRDMIRQLRIHTANRFVFFFNSGNIEKSNGTYKVEKRENSSLILRLTLKMREENLNKDSRTFKRLKLIKSWVGKNAMTKTI